LHGIANVRQIRNLFDLCAPFCDLNLHGENSMKHNESEVVTLEQVTDPHILECLQSPVMALPSSSRQACTLSLAELVELLKQADQSDPP
jgi:hypothetical protein